MVQVAFVAARSSAIPRRTSGPRTDRCGVAWDILRRCNALHCAMTFRIVTLLFLAYLLFLNYAKDKGSYTRAKVVHALALAYVVLTNAGSFKTLASQVQHFSSFKAHHSVPVGFISAQLNFISVLLAAIFGLVLLLTALMVAQRNPIAVRIFRITLLVSLPISVIGFYRGFLSETAALPDKAVLLIAVTVMGAIKLGLFFLYGTSFMREFLNSPSGGIKSGNSWKEQA